MDSFRETIIDLLEKFLFQLNLLFDLESSTLYIVLAPFFKNIAKDPLAFIITILALFLIPYIMIRVRRNTVIQGGKAEKLLKKLEMERSIKIPEEELELPEPESALYDKTSEPYFDQNKVVEDAGQTTKADKESDPELEFLKDLNLDSMYTKTYSIEDSLEENESEEAPIPGDEPEEVIAKDPVKDFASAWEFTEEEGPGDPVITPVTEEKPADFEEVLHETSEVTNIEEPENVSDESLDRMETIDDLTRQMEATIETISNQIITEDIDQISTPRIPPEVMDEETSSAATFDAESAKREESHSLDDEEPAITTPIPPQEADEPSLKNEQDFADTGLNKVLGFPLEEDENAESLSVNAEETEKTTDSDPKPRFPENLERSEVLPSAESAEAPETGISEPVVSDKTRKIENTEKKTKLLVDRLENFQKHLEERLTTLELTLEKRKTAHND